MARLPAVLLEQLGVRRSTTCLRLARRLGLLELVVVEKDVRANSLLRPTEEYTWELAVVERGSRAASGAGNPKASAMHRLRMPQILGSGAGNLTASEMHRLKVPQILGCMGTNHPRRRTGRHLEQEEVAGIRREPARGHHLEQEEAASTHPELEDNGRRVLGVMPR